MTRLFFYLRYAANNLRRGGQWTIFALFCVAAGVATVVALRGLGLSITDSLLGNLRQYNHGDINISQLRGLGPFAIGLQGGQEERLVFRRRKNGWSSGRIRCSLPVIGRGRTAGK